MKARLSLYLIASALLGMVSATVGCSKAPADAQIASDIQNKLNADSGLQGKQLVVQAANGSVTLSGQVDNHAQRDAAARYASSEPGVRQIVNNLQVSPPFDASVAQAQPPEQPKPSPATKQRHTAPKDVAHDPS